MCGVKILDLGLLGGRNIMFGKKKLYKITYICYNLEYSTVFLARSPVAAVKKLFRNFQVNDIVSVEEIKLDGR